jgi:alkylation response protein AidB-like acyl-CoA dehydrogenase
MAYGDKGGAVGYLLGEANRGLEYMFIMMNEARLGVGLQGIALGDAPTSRHWPTPASASRAATR